MSVIEDFVLRGLNLVVRGVFEVLDVVGVERRHGRQEIRPEARAAVENLKFAKPAFEPFPPAAERLVDRLGQGGQPALEDRQREPNRPGVFVVFQGVGPVELLANVVCDRLVEMGLRIGKLVGDRQDRVEQVREANSLSFGDQAKERPVAIEAPGAAEFHNLDPRLVVAVEQLVGHLASRRLVGQLDRLRAEPLHADHRDQRVGQDAAHRRVGEQVIEFGHPGTSQCGPWTRAARYPSADRGLMVACPSPALCRSVP